jgi:YHS domain-containing protein
MQVDPASSAGSFDHEGTVHHFCSVRCLDKFKNDPDRFLIREKPQAAATKGSVLAPLAAAAPSYTCPMHPEIRQDHPVSCPKCGMALEPLAPIQPISKNRIRLSDASADRPFRAGRLSNLRHDAGIARRKRR